VADSAASTGRHVADSYRSTERAVDTLLHGERPAPTYSGPIEINDGRTRDFANVQSGSTATQTDLRDPRLGLTRIVQTAPGVFTDAADAQGDVRYYDRTGSRADTYAPTGVSANTSVRDYNRAEAATAMDMTAPANQTEVANRGLRGLARSETMLQEGADRAARDAEMALTPEQRNERDVAMMEQMGLDRRAAAELQGRMTLEQAKLLAEQEGREFDANQALIEQMNNDRAYRREDPEGFAREQMAML